MTSVLIADSVEEELRQTMKKHGIDFNYQPDISPEELLSAIPDYEGLIVRSRTQVTEEVLGRGKRLEIIGRPGVGTENIDVETATQNGIAVVYSPYANITSVAEQVVQSILGFYRPLSRFDHEVKEGRWPKGEIPIQQIEGKTIGILGYGNVGEVLAKRLENFGADIVYHDPYTTKHPPYPNVPLDELFLISDVVSVHTQGAEGIVTQELLESMPPGGIFVNTARPNVLEPGSLENALQRRNDLRAAIDVHSEEGPGYKLLSEFSERVILTPHVAGSSQEAQKQAAIDIGSQVVDYLDMGIASSFANQGLLRVSPDYYPHLRTAWHMANVASSQGWNGKQPAILQIQTDKELRQCRDDALKIASSIGSNRALGSKVNWLNPPDTGNVRFGGRELETPYGNSVEVTANIGDRKISATGSPDNGSTFLRHLQVYSGGTANTYSGISHPMDGVRAIFLYEDSPGALEVLSGMAASYGLNIVESSQRTSENRSSALSMFTLEGSPEYMLKFTNHLPDLNYLNVSPRGKKRRLTVHDAFVIQ
jgi:D-3-phosphoglycerate dehydrogenase / 2-oxoglutarate reductase